MKDWARNGQCESAAGKFVVTGVSKHITPGLGKKPPIVFSQSLGYRRRFSLLAAYGACRDMDERQTKAESL